MSFAVAITKVVIKPKFIFLCHCACRLAENSVDLEDSPQTDYQTNSQSDDNEIIYWKQRPRLLIKPKVSSIYLYL